MLASWRLQSTRITSCLRPSLLSRLKQSTVLVLVVFFLYTFILDHETFRRTWEYKPEADLSCPTIRLPSPIEAAVAATVWQCLTELFDTHKPTPDLERPAEFTITDAEKVTDYYTVSHALSLEPNDVEMSRKTHAALVAALPEYPENLYTGRGIVVVGGGNYSEFAATSLGMLRHVGSELPVELWMKNDIEAQPEWCGELAAEGIACRLLSDYMDVSRLSGYQLRPAAMLLSSFQEILYLDADSNVIRNPDTLSDTKTFQERGAVLWPDFWKSTESPMTCYITGASKYKVAPGASKIQTVESGQMLWDKRRHWKTLCLSTYYNYHGPSYYYNLITQGAPGWGDKDTFPTALRSLNAPWHLVQVPVRHLWENRANGLPIAMPQLHPPPSTKRRAPTKRKALRPPEDWRSFTPLFLHANWKKWGVRSLMCDICPAIPTSGPSLHSTPLPDTSTFDPATPPTPQITGRFSTPSDSLFPLLNSHKRILRLKEVAAWSPGYKQSSGLEGWRVDPERDMWAVMAKVACQRTRDYLRGTFGVEVREGEREGGKGEEGKGDRGACRT